MFCVVFRLKKQTGGRANGILYVLQTNMNKYTNKYTYISFETKTNTCGYINLKPSKYLNGYLHECTKAHFFC